MKHHLAAVITAFQFLTVMPSLIRRPLIPAELGKAVGFFPLVGLMFGLLLVGCHWFLSILFPKGVLAFLLLVVWILCTGALHFDGFLDTCDGLLGGWTVEDRLRILRDERVGAFAVAGGVLLLLGKYASLVALTDPIAALIVVPTLGRWAMSMAIVRHPYARPQGLGRSMKDKANWQQALIATLVASATAAILGGWQGVVALGVVATGTWFIARFALARLPGLTGDLYGAICELGELLALLVFVSGRVG